MEILNSLKDLLGNMSNGLRAAVIIVAILAGLGYAYITKPGDAPKPKPSIGTVNQGGDLNNVASSTVNNTITF